MLAKEEQVLAFSLTGGAASTLAPRQLCHCL